MSSSDSLMIREASYVVMGLGYVFGISSSIQGSREYMLHGLLSATRDAFRVGQRGEDLGTKKSLGSEEARKQLWEHTVKVVDVE
ncbi:hypothetical protein M413DRAFT_444894 [Hebeloma cylindrosporum]|uniref:Uncharacterized protein n=1 Tax=Hebeloma cylindrosporum TaxID=76867 RepID=A0A0C2XXT7_HEBCY|nr:hypothetical protein M413DRAFT_444894 [Hebeloma cylindrosporum h7]